MTDTLNATLSKLTAALTLPMDRRRPSVVARMKKARRVLRHGGPGKGAAKGTSVVGKPAGNPRLSPINRKPHGGQLVCEPFHPRMQIKKPLRESRQAPER